MAAEAGAQRTMPAAEADEDEIIEVEENLADLGGAADDGDDTDPHKFIGKSLHYQDLLMSERHADERLQFFTKFAESMPKGKSPFGKDGNGGKIGKFRARKERASKRIAAFRDKYAENRAAAKKTRVERIAKEKAERKEEEMLGKPLKSAISKSMKKAQTAAAKAALIAIQALAKETAEEEVLKVGMEAFQGALKEAVKAAA